MSIKMFVLCAVAVVLLAPSADSQCGFAPGGDECSTPFTVDDCLIGGMASFSMCFQNELDTKVGAVTTRVEALETKQMTLMDMQTMIKKTLECVNRGGMECPKDGMCYLVKGKRNFIKARTACAAIKDGALISELPDDPEVVQNCLLLDVDDIVWLNEDPTNGGATCKASKVITGFAGQNVDENCSDKNALQVCKITITM